MDSGVKKPVVCLKLIGEILASAVGDPIPGRIMRSIERSVWSPSLEALLKKKNLTPTMIHELIRLQTVHGF